MKKAITRVLSLLLVTLLVFGMGIYALALNGDVNKDGEVTILDVMMILKAVTNGKSLENSDFNGDGKTTLLDVIGALKSITTGKAPEVNEKDESSKDVVVEDGKVKESVSINGENVSAAVPEGVEVNDGTTALTLSVTALDSTNGNITTGENEDVVSYDVHIEGVSVDNTVAIVVDLGAILPVGQNTGTVALYHVENGASVKMTQVMSLAELDAHNEFYYYPATGNVYVALATFSEIIAVNDTENLWNCTADHTWYTENPNATEFTIANANQLWSFSQIVGGMANDDAGNPIAQDSFDGKTVKLVADVDLGDAEKSNRNVIFYPIGYWNSIGEYVRDNIGEEGVSSGFYTFEGTFDGTGHTIQNIYQNTWEMIGDHDWYNPKDAYFRDGMGLFGRVYGGTVKNITVKNFSSDGEITTTGVIAAYADFGATFENIAIFNCNPRVYNIGNGGIVGCVGWYTKDKTDKKVTFENITVDNTNKISALWGSYDVSCGGIVGQYYPTSGQTSAGNPANAGISFINCHVAAQMDVYNDVCANYQYYAYRYAGILMGSVRENVTGDDGHVYPKMDGIEAKDCTVHFGDWNDYYYCEIIDNTTASYTHDYQMSRLEQVASVDVENRTVTTLKGDVVAIPASGRANYVVVNETDKNGFVHATENATCYHFKDDEVWTHDMGGIDEGIDENGDGIDDIKEDKQHIYLEFNNLVTGYGWGVTTKAVGDMAGVTILDRKEANSVIKFESVAKAEYTTGTTVTIEELFKAIENAGVEIKDANVEVFVSPVGENSTANGTYVADTTDWTQGELTFTGLGAATVTITDYYFCEPTVINVTVEERQPEVKFEVVMNNGDFLHRVGNSGTVAWNKLFKAKDGMEIGTVDVSVESVEGTSATGKYSSADGTIQFNNTGVVKVTITDNDYCKPTELYLEVVDAVNVTAATNATANNVVLLNNIGSGFTVSGRYTVYGNGFTLTYTGNGQYLNNGLKHGIVTVSENGTLDNLRIVATIYPKAYMYYGKSVLGDYVQGGPSSVEGDKTRYHYQLSAVAASGNATISNCYIYGGRNNIFVNTGDVTIKGSVLECGTVANVQIQSNSSHTITFENVTTIQHQVKATIVETDKVMLGAGVLVGPDTTENPTIVLNGNFKQYNWVTADDVEAVKNDKAMSLIINGALDATDYNHTINGKTSSNLGIIYMNEEEVIVINNTKLPYKTDSISMTYAGNTVKGKVCSLQNATADKIYSDLENADKTTANGLYVPQFKYYTDLGGQYIEKTDDGDEFCYREGDTIFVMFPSGDTKELDLAAMVDITKYTGQDLNLVITCKDENANVVVVAGNKVALSATGTYTVTYTVTDNLFYDEDGKEINKSKNYSWDVTVSVSLKDTKVPDARFEFDSTKQKMGYYKPAFGDVKQYLPFLAGLKIYDYNGQEEYLRFDGSSDFNKVASITITGYESNKALVEIKLTDGGIINTRFLARANSGGGSTYTGKIKTSNNTIYFVNDGGTSNKDTTTTAAYWYVDFYKFTGNNGTPIQSGQQTFNSTGSSASTPSGSFGTTIKYTVSYDANGGNCGQNTGYATSASTTVTLPTATRSGYIFAGWYTAASGGTRVGGAGENYTPSANITLYAQWGKPCTVTYDANGGTCGTPSEKYTGEALTLPTPTRDGYWFIGWYDAATGGNKVGDAGAKYNPANEITLYAHWQEKVEYTVTYDANGGTCGTASVTYQGTALTLPTATRTGYTFNGWHTATSGGTKIGDAGASYVPSANITLYAQWTQNEYTLTVSTSNATVTGVTNGQKAYYGDEISVTVSFTQSNNKTLTVKDASGNTILSESAAGTYPFTMPDSNVTISASSEKSCVTPDTLVMLADGTQKRIDEVTYNDELLVWDFFNGEYTKIPSSIIFAHESEIVSILTLEFDDGTVVKTINGHGFFDIKVNDFVIIDEESVSDYIGCEFFKVDGNGYKAVKLVDYSVHAEETEIYSIQTVKYINFVVEGMLSITPPPFDGWFDYFEIGNGMKYDEEKMNADIEKYGLYEYEDFADYVTYEQFVAFNGPYLKVLVGKGIVTYDGILELIATYVNP